MAEIGWLGRRKEKVISALINSFLIFLISEDQYLLFDHQYNQNINCRFFISQLRRPGLYFNEKWGRLFVIA